jgi:hypothetical protein
MAPDTLDLGRKKKLPLEFLTTNAQTGRFLAGVILHLNFCGRTGEKSRRQTRQAEQQRENATSQSQPTLPLILSASKNLFN